MKFYPNVFFKIIKSNKIIIFIILNFLLSLAGFIFTKGGIENQVNDHYVIKITSILGTGYNYLTLGILLWLFIMFEILTLFKINNDNGIMLNQITKPISRKSYYYQLLLAIYLVFILVTFINILFTFLAAVIVFQTINMNMILITLSAFVFSFIRIAYIRVIMAFVALFVNVTEISIFVSAIVSILLFAFNLVGSYIASLSTWVYRIYTFLIGHETAIYLFLVDKVFYPFSYQIANHHIMNQPSDNNYLYNITGFNQAVPYDIDLGFAAKLPFLLDSLYNILYFIVTFAVIYLLAKLSIRKFEHSDITGN
jgi:hypothetical protein